jgi:hypothetical protein
VPILLVLGAVALTMWQALLLGLRLLPTLVLMVAAALTLIGWLAWAICVTAGLLLRLTAFAGPRIASVTAGGAGRLARSAGRVRDRHVPLADLV